MQRQSKTLNPPINRLTFCSLFLLASALLTLNPNSHAATINAARMIGKSDELGTVEKGKLADLLILDANPLEDIRNTKKIYRVIKGGRSYDPRQLQELRGR